MFYFIEKNKKKRFLKMSDKVKNSGGGNGGQTKFANE